MDYPRCTNCRNPIKAHQSRVTNPADGQLYHQDCWGTAFSVLQADYLRRIESDGVDALLSPYVCRQPDAWVPEQRESDSEVLEVEAAPA